MRQRGEGALEARHRFPIGGAFDGSGPGPAEVDHGVIPDLTLGVVQTEREMMRFQTPCVECGERLSYAAVKDLAAWPEDLAVRHLAHAVVREIKVLAHGVQHAPADQFLHSPSGLVLLQSRDVRQQGELELTTHHGGQGRQLAAPLVEPVKLAGDDASDALG